MRRDVWTDLCTIHRMSYDLVPSELLMEYIVQIG